MTRRTDSQTAEKLSIALLTRAAFGTKAGLRTALSYGLHATLVEAVFARPVFLVRMEFLGASPAADRRTRAR
jgi:hypothetical protein